MTGNNIIDGVLVVLAVPWLVCMFAALAMLTFVYICLVVKVFAEVVEWLLPKDIQ